MKDFINWLGINEKIAKLVVWIFLIIVFLIIINAALDSLGFPYYKITADNLARINTNKLLEHIFSWMLSILNFYATILLVFRINNYKKIFKYSLLYLLINIIVNHIFGYALSQIFIIIFIIAFCYYYSNKNNKYILYALLALIVNTIVQYICYIYKIQFIDYNTINYIEKSILSLDYFIIMIIIIALKEIYINKKKKKEGEKKWLLAGYGLENSKKKKPLLKK